MADPRLIAIHNNTIQYILEEVLADVGIPREVATLIAVRRLQLSWSYQNWLRWLTSQCKTCRENPVNCQFFRHIPHSPVSMSVRLDAILKGQQTHCVFHQPLETIELGEDPDE